MSLTLSVGKRPFVGGSFKLSKLKSLEIWISEAAFHRTITTILISTVCL